MQVRHREVFTSIQTEGAILPPDLLKRIFSGDRDLDGLKSKDYHLSEREKLNEAINRSWNVLQGYWRSFLTGKEKLAKGDLGTTLTRERWLLPLFQELGYGRLLTHKAIDIESKTYPISHIWHKTPIHLVGCKVDLDRRMAKVAGAARSSPHSLVQELLNRSDDYLWAFLSNGARLRILRDNLSLTRQAYVEFDLETMMEGEIYSDFVLLWLLCHQSRVEADKPEEFWLEKWSKTAQEKGTRALDQLRDGVEDAIKDLGSGFLKHPINLALREKLKAGQLDKQDYYRQILRLIYRLLFLFVAEDRDMLFDPDSKTEAQEFYIEHYSTTRLRRMAEKLRGSRHTDLYQGFRLVSEKLGDNGCPELGLPALGSFLFSKNKALPDLETSEISNEDFLNAIRALAYTLDQGTLRAVDYKNLGSEEFGSVYESLLELHPDINIDAGTFELKAVSGHERKTTGSYYTPSSLVQCLLDSALNPVLDEALKKPNPEKAMLDLKICDPASGSGHFLIAAAHRVARRLAAIRTGDEEPAPEATRAALRDVISHCIYGVDLNPMAVELCKVALWMESLDPGKALSFLDHKIQCGNSLLGTTPKLLADGIPNAAFKSIEGDDTKYCSVLHRRNEHERQGQMTMWVSMAAESRATYGSLCNRYRSIDEMDDASAKAVAEKEIQYERLLESSNYQHSKLIADAWCAAFVWPKQTDAPEPITEDIFRQVQSKTGRIPATTLEEIENLRDKYNFFHWHLAFPDVFYISQNRMESNLHKQDWSGGFDVMTGNPPWERIKLEERSWFAEYDTEIANARNTAERRQMIMSLQYSNPELFQKYKTAKRTAKAIVALVRGVFPLGGVGDLNTFSIFADLFLTRISPSGLAGLIVPTSLITDYTYKDFFIHLIDNDLLREAIDFVNSTGLFPAVDRNQKFCLLTIGKQHQKKAKFAFGLHVASEANKKSIELGRNDFYLVNPNTRTCPAFHTTRDAALIMSIYKQIPILESKKSENSNDWKLDIWTMFHMSNDSRYFSESSEGLVNRSDFWPLYEGKIIHQFDHRYSHARPPSAVGGIRGRADHISIDDKINPFLFAETRYCVQKTEILSRARGHNWFFGYREIGGAVANMRSMIAAAIPFSAVNNKIILFAPVNKAQFSFAPALLANLNSFVFDYILRQKMTGTSISIYIVKQVPVLHPEAYCQVRANMFELPILEWIKNRVLELSYTAWDVEKFAAEACSYSGPPFRWGEERRHLIKCELDAMYFLLYSLKLEDVNFILDNFPILKRQEMRAFKKFRTKEQIISIYKRMRRATEFGESYKSFLDPPPADQLLAHPPRSGYRPSDSIWFLSDLLQSNPRESTIRVQLPENFRFEGSDSRGVAKFRMLEEDERMTQECQVVIVRHPKLRQGENKVNIAVGKFYWAEQRDVETGKPFILITLRTNGVPVRLKLSLEEWKQFRPLAVLKK